MCRGWTLRQSCPNGERRRTPRVSAEGHAGRGGGASGFPNPQDRARRRMPVWRTTALGASRLAKRAAFVLYKNSLKLAANLEAVEDGLFQFSGRACARQTRLSQEKGEGV